VVGSLRMALPCGILKAPLVQCYSLYYNNSYQLLTPLPYVGPGAHYEKEHPTTETALVYTVFVLDHTWMGESLLQLITPMYNFVHEPAVAFCVQCALR